MHLEKFIATNTVINAEPTKDTMFFNFLLTLRKHVFIIQNSFIKIKIFVIVHRKGATCAKVLLLYGHGQGF